MDNFPKIDLHMAAVAFCGELGLATAEDLRDFISNMPNGQEASKHTGQNKLDIEAGLVLKSLAIKQLANTIGHAT